MGVVFWGTARISIAGDRLSSRRGTTVIPKASRDSIRKRLASSILCSGTFRSSEVKEIAPIAEPPLEKLSTILPDR